ncbi:glycoside hydrolase superfamily [Parachaetomium inaequale]|uniref:Glycoside hydrolase superfamily n=1 Tax=Parachaetomium inaequale TaxID=2588326 RepID=A0AAN6PG94_9PEZI|nr:glycoside hydrolase superfamily [Parachaetomium inaequale]
MLLLLLFAPLLAGAQTSKPTRERISLNEGWKFSRFTTNPDSLSYDTLKSWILPSANDFIKGSPHQPPSGTAPGSNITYVQAYFDDSAWEGIDLPHDWAVKGPFNAPGISGGMGRLPTNGVGWYRRKVALSRRDMGKSVFLDIDGAMSYAAVWLNGHLVGGWPYGFASFRLDLTPYLKAGGDNLLAIRVDNAVENSRWYPGAGIYRNVWLVKTNPTHVGQFGTYITTSDVSEDSATVKLVVDVENDGSSDQAVDVVTEIHVLDSTTGTGKPGAEVVAKFKEATVSVPAGGKKSVDTSTTVRKPLLWGPAPQKPNMYVAVTTLSVNKAVIDTYETPFGIRSVKYDANKGVLINGKPVRVFGTNNHGDYGSLGAAYNARATQRQLEMLQELGNNALRTSHNPPTPELLDMADHMGFMVVDEIFDCWNIEKRPNDFHLIFPDWHEPDLRSFIRRDRNHPSVIAWSFGNELPEQSTAAGGATAKILRDIIAEEDPTRPNTAAMNNAGPGSPLADTVDIIGLNYQGEGHGTSTNGSFDRFHAAYPNKLIWSSESASALSTRGTYIFPVTPGNSATVGPGSGGDGVALQVSAYELYAPSWGSSPDKVFEAQDRHAYVAGEFVWTGWDYLGEPTPYDEQARSSYFGIIDLAGFKKDRFYLYQARWRPDFAMAHILPHWTWPDRVGEVTPVHVFSSGDEAELFVNGKSAGKQKRGQYESRFRWDDVVYQPGNVSVVVYKEGKQWAVDTKRTVGEAKGLTLTADRAAIRGDGLDLSFVTVAVVDKNGVTVPRASDEITFAVSGPGQIVSTDNGDPADMTAFPSLTRKAFSGLALAVVRANKGASGDITVTASAKGLEGTKVTVRAS